MHRLSKALIVPVVAALMLVACYQEPRAAEATPSAQQERTAKVRKAGAAARARVAVKASATEVTNEVIRLFTERGYSLVRQKGTKLLFQQQASPALVQSLLGSGFSGTATAHVVVIVKEKKGRTRVAAHMVLVTDTGAARKQKTRVTADEVVQELSTTLGMVKANAEA